MTERVLITGGAGFIGSHLADELLAAGYRVRALDSLEPQVHGPGGQRPGYLSPDVELLVGDVRDASAVRTALADVQCVVHLAAAVGVGQSMYEIARYTAVNDLGTAVLLEALIDHPVQRLVVASSMSIYGEGLYHDANGREVAAVERSEMQLNRGDWEFTDENGGALTPIRTPETKPPHATSVYALSKSVQEQMCLIFGRAYHIPTVALRFFNAYGPRQALSNPYTGVLAIFSSRVLNGQPPLVFEDGRQQRDFVNVHDVARACRLALETREVSDRAVNIGSGTPVAIGDIADQVCQVLGRPDLKPQITGKYRVGDIRHCFADISAAKRDLDYQPQVSFTDGLQELSEWLVSQDGQTQSGDRFTQAKNELELRGLVV